MTWLLLALGIGCPKRQIEPIEVAMDEVEIAVDLPGTEVIFRVVDGLWADRETGMSIEVLEGWSGQPGSVGDPLRIRLVHAASGASLEVRALEPSGLTPRARTGCNWAFSDEGSYSSLRVTGVVRIASCVPVDPGAPRVLATLTTHGAWDWHFELLVPQGYLVAATSASDSLLATVRFAK